MELNSIEDVKALTEYQKIEQIQSVEKKIHKLSFVPATISAVLILWAFWAFWATWVDSLWSPMNIVLVAIAIASVGHSNIQRTDLLKQLFELKYGK